MVNLRNGMFMKKVIVLSLIFCALLQTGCATYFAKKHYDETAPKAIRVEADGNSVAVGVDLLSMEYLQDNWKVALPAAIVDGFLIYKGAEWVRNATSGGRDVNQRNNSVNVSGNDDSYITINVSGDEDNDSTSNNHPNDSYNQNY